MKIRRVIPLLVAALSVSACGLPTRPDRVEYRHNSYDTTIHIDIDRAPPAPLVEHPPQRVVAGHFWAPGYWIWQGTRHSWVSGTWLPERPGHTHVASRWERRGDRWHFEPARYEEHRGARIVRTRHEEEKAPARHIEQRAAARTPDVHTMERRSEHRQTVASVERRTDPSPNVRAAEKSRTEVKQAAHAEERRTDPPPKMKTAEKADPEKASTAAVPRKEERDVHKLAHATERGGANESRERGVRRDAGSRL